MPLREHDITWGITGCFTPGCPGDAEIIVDDMEAVCLECADKLVERWAIIAQFGHDALRNLPPAGEWFEVVHPFRKWGKDDPSL